jgi:hypothetical protein
MAVPLLKTFANGGGAGRTFTGISEIQMRVILFRAQNLWQAKGIKKP